MNRSIFSNFVSKRSYLRTRLLQLTCVSMQSRKFAKTTASLAEQNNHQPESFKERWLQRLESTLSSHPGLSTASFMLSDMVCVLGLSQLLQIAHVPLSPTWIVAATLSEAVKLPIQAAALGALTPLTARIFPSLKRIRTGSVARAMFAKAKQAIGNRIGKKSSEPSSMESTPSAPTTPDSSSSSQSSVHWIENFANDYGAAGFVTKNLISLVIRAVLFTMLYQGVDLTWLNEHVFAKSWAVKQASYLTFAASLSIPLLPLRLMSPAIIAPPLVKIFQRIRSVK